MDKLETALRATGYAWAHYAWSRAPEGDFGTWGEEGANILRADDRSNLRATRYSIHYFTRDASSAGLWTTSTLRRTPAISTTSGSRR